MNFKLLLISAFLVIVLAFQLGETKSIGQEVDQVKEVEYFKIISKRSGDDDDSDELDNDDKEESSQSTSDEEQKSDESKKNSKQNENKGKDDKKVKEEKSGKTKENKSDKKVEKQNDDKKSQKGETKSDKKSKNDKSSKSKTNKDLTGSHSHENMTAAELEEHNKLHHSNNSTGCCKNSNCKSNCSCKTCHQKNLLNKTQDPVASVATALLNALKNGVNITNTNGTVNIVVAIAAPGGSVNVNAANGNVTSLGNSSIQVVRVSDQEASSTTTVAKTTVSTESTTEAEQVAETTTSSAESEEVSPDQEA